MQNKSKLYLIFKSALTIFYFTIIYTDKTNSQIQINKIIYVHVYVFDIIIINHFSKIVKLPVA